MQIKITGEQGEGKTTVAEFLSAALKSVGVCPVAQSEEEDIFNLTLTPEELASLGSAVGELEARITAQAAIPALQHAIAEANRVTPILAQGGFEVYLTVSEKSVLGLRDPIPVITARVKRDIV